MERDNKKENPKHWVDNQFGYVETRENYGTGLCPICGSVNIFPKKIGVLYVCSNCVRTRELSDILKISKNLQEVN